MSIYDKIPHTKLVSSSFPVATYPTSTTTPPVQKETPHFSFMSYQQPTPPSSSPPKKLKQKRTSSTLSFMRLIKEKFDRDLHIHPHQVTRVLSIRPVREEGVRKIMTTIQQCGWASSNLFASDRGDDQPPVLVEGNHRVEALRRLLNEKNSSWLLPGETPQDFKVKITVLKGLTLDDEARIGREANHINANHVSMTLIDHIVAMYRALTATRLRKQISPRASVSIDLLLATHPDYKRYHKSTIRAWKRMAEGLAPQARKLLLKTHAQGLKSGDVRLAFSKKTLIESQMMQNLKDWPGVQFWYLKRLIYLENQGKTRAHTAKYFKGVIIRLKNFAQAFRQFSKTLMTTFDLPSTASYLANVLETGSPGENLNNSLMKPLLQFTQNYLWTNNRDKEIQALLQKRKHNDSVFPYVFYQLVAQLRFNEDYAEADKIFTAPDSTLQLKFTSPVDPTQNFQNYLQSLQKKRSHSSLDAGPSKKKQKILTSQSKDADRDLQPDPPMETKDTENLPLTTQIQQNIQPPRPSLWKPMPSTHPPPLKSAMHTSKLTIEIIHREPSILRSCLLQELMDEVADFDIPQGEKVRLLVQENQLPTREQTFP